MLIPFTESFDLSSTLESGQAFRWNKNDESNPEGIQSYTGVIFNNLVKLSHSSHGIDFSCSPDPESTLKPLIQNYLRLDDDLNVIYKDIGTDDRIKSSIAKYPGMRLIRQEPWECLISFICSSNSNIPRIRTNIKDMSKYFGHTISLNNQFDSTFPTPEELCEAGEIRLRNLGLGFRAKYVASTARIIANGEVDLFKLRETNYEDALEILTSLRGVGDKVANCVLLFSMDKLDAFPVDVWIGRALGEWYLNRSCNKLSPKNMRIWAQGRFGSYAGYANQYLFHDRRLLGKSKSYKTSKPS